jgi:hypothetical protein
MGVTPLGLNIQQYLRSGKSRQDLEDDYGIYSYEHPELPLVGFKYGLILCDREKFSPVVREARGIVLERDSWDVVAFPFKRFFNLGEDKETESRFNWNDFTCQEKVDGSLIIVYYYGGVWRVNTSGSFAQGICYDSGVTWEELFWTTSGIYKGQLNKECTYIFELWTKYNKIVRSYKPSVWLLGMKCQGPANHGWDEIYQSEVDLEATELGVKRPVLYKMNSIDEMTDFLLQTSRSDPTFEGFVLCDRNFNRIKIKSDSYKQLHQLKGNGQFIYRNIIPQILNGNLTKLARDFPEWLEELEQCDEKISNLKIETDNLWWEFGKLSSRKEFAQNVIRYATLPAILFNLKDGKFASVEDAFAKSEDLLIKYFEGKK